VEQFIRYIKDEETGEFIPFPIEINDSYLVYEGGEVWFSFTDIKIGQVNDSDHFGYQWTCSYRNDVDYLPSEFGSWTLLSRKYDTLENATKALWADLVDKARYETVLDHITNGEQTLEYLGLFQDQDADAEKVIWIP